MRRGHIEPLLPQVEVETTRPLEGIPSKCQLRATTNNETPRYAPPVNRVSQFVPACLRLRVGAESYASMPRQGLDVRALAQTSSEERRSKIRGGAMSKAHRVVGLAFVRPTGVHRSSSN